VVSLLFYGLILVLLPRLMRRGPEPPAETSATWL